MKNTGKIMYRRENRREWYRSRKAVEEFLKIKTEIRVQATGVPWKSMGKL